MNPELIRLVPQIANLLAVAADLTGLDESVKRGIRTLGALLVQVEPAVRDLEALRDVVQRMVAEQREPTDAEWADLKARSDAAHKAIQDVDLTE